MSITTANLNPNATTTTSQTTQVPAFYQQYLDTLASQGASALQGAQYAGPSQLQTSAFSDVTANKGAYQPQLDAAGKTISSVNPNSPLQTAQPYLSASTNPAYNTVGNYMNPYIGSVVNEIGRLGERNINEVLAPEATAGAVGSGQFGSQRGQQVLGNTIRDALQGITGQQSSALATGYGQALTAAQQQQQLEEQAAQTAGGLAATGNTQALAQGQAQAGLAQQNQSQKLADVNAEATLGQTQQQLNQAKTLFPFQALSDYGSLLSGVQIPTTSVGQTTAPAGSSILAPSTLSQVLGTAGNVAGLASQIPGIANTAINAYNTYQNTGLSGLLNYAGINFKNGGPVGGLEYE